MSRVIDDIQSLVKALELGGYNAAPSALRQGQVMTVVDIGPFIEYVVRTGPVALGGNGEDPQKVAAELGIDSIKGDAP